ncbi:MAG: PilZ domain-containing protein [Mariprofundaceae bacterium]|nr:PilZ domain-containing protein [Mariprofundaceae bacterium]
MVAENESRRKHERRPVHFEVEVFLRQGAVKEYVEMAVLNDISGGGLCFASTRPEVYAAGQELSLNILLPGSDRLDSQMQGDATVVWTRLENEAEGVRGRVGVVMDGLLAFDVEPPDVTSGDPDRYSGLL